MKRTPYFMRGVLQGVGGFEIKNYRSFFILSPSILSAFPYHYPSYEVTYYSWGFKYHITNKGKNKPFPKVGQGLLNGDRCLIDILNSQEITDPSYGHYQDKKFPRLPG